MGRVSHSSSSTSDQSASDPATPEVTPQITSQQAQRVNAPARAMLFSMIALLLILLPVVWLQPHPDKHPYKPSVNLSQVAHEAQGPAGFPVAAPKMPSSWNCNYARWNGDNADGVSFWDMGWATPSGAFFTVTQTKSANPTWIAQHTDNAVPAGSVQAAGTTWETRLVHQEKEEGPEKKAWIGKVGSTQVLVYGDGKESEAQDLLQAVADSVHQQSQD